VKVQVVSSAPESEREDLPQLGANFKIVTLKELGARLPLGMADIASGDLFRALSMRRWTLKTEKQLGKLRDEHRREGHGRFVSMVVASLYEKLGNLVLGDLSEGGTGSKASRSHWHGALGAISQMWFGDVLYAWIWLRRQIIGPHLDMQLQCTHCRSLVAMQADLDTLDVRTVDKLADAYWKYTLQVPFEVRGKLVEQLEVGPARWHVMEAESKNADVDLGALKSSIIFSSIRSVVGQEEIALVESEIENMDKVDVETLTSAIDATAVGPDMKIEAYCSKCRTDFEQALQWSYDRFFGVSGRSAPRTR
jgi:hypothetical protein